jgi:hypothetical protein
VEIIRSLFFLFSLGSIFSFFAVDMRRLLFLVISSALAVDMLQDPFYVGSKTFLSIFLLYFMKEVTGNSNIMDSMFSGCL